MNRSCSLASLLPNRSVCAVSVVFFELLVLVFVSVGVVSVVSFPNHLSAKRLNSNSKKSSFTASLFIGTLWRFSASKSTGTAKFIVANFLDKKANSLLSSTFSFCFPLSSCVFSYKPSILPYKPNSFFAVLSPTPGIPGILSEASPIIPK